MKDFQFYKQKFAQQQKEIKLSLKRFAHMEEVFYNNNSLSFDDLEDGAMLHSQGSGTQSQQQVIAKFNGISDQIQLEIDELEEILNEVQKLSYLQASERSVQLRLKNQMKELQVEYNQIKKLLKSQLRANQYLFSEASHNSNSTASRRGQSRMMALASESSNLDRTIAMTQDIISVGNASAQSLTHQTQTMKNTSNTLKMLENSAIPGAEKLMKMINKANHKQTIVLGFVIACCIVCTLYSLGFVDLLKSITGAVAPATQSIKTVPDVLEELKEQQEIGEVISQIPGGGDLLQDEHETTISLERPVPVRLPTEDDLTVVDEGEPDETSPEAIDVNY